MNSSSPIEGSLTTNAGDPPSIPTAVEWARRTLDLAADQPASAARAHLLRLLEGEDFVPPEDWSDAIGVLVADGALCESASDLAANATESPPRRVPDPLPYRQHVEQHVAQLVTHAASCHISLPISDRAPRLRHLDLHSQAFPRQKRRVQRLFRTLRLELPAPSPGDEHEAALIEFFRASCALDERSQARLRQQRLTDWSGDADSCHVAVRIQQGQSDIASRFPEFFERMITGHQRLTKAQRRRQRRQRVRSLIAWPFRTLDSLRRAPWVRTVRSAIGRVWHGVFATICALSLLFILRALAVQGPDSALPTTLPRQLSSPRSDGFQREINEMLKSPDVRRGMETARRISESRAKRTQTMSAGDDDSGVDGPRPPILFEPEPVGAPGAGPP